MPELRSLTPKRLVAALKRSGFYEVRQKGSHLQLKKGNLLVTVPMHPGNISPGILKSILRQARLSAKELREVL